MAKKAEGKVLTYQPPANAKEWQHDPLPLGRTKEQDIAAMVADGLIGRKVSDGDRSGPERPSAHPSRPAKSSTLTEALFPGFRRLEPTATRG